MSTAQIAFFKINAADYTDPDVIVTASQGSTYAPFVQRRSNTIGWMTTGSVDADNTTLTCNFVNQKTISEILLVGHNFKAYTLKYWNGSAYVDFATPISVTGSTDSTTRHSVSSVQTTALQLTVTGTQVANSEKKLNQFIATTLIGKLNGWPVIKKPEFNLNKIVNTMLSGKTNLGINVGAFNCQLSVSNWSDATDLTTVETLYGSSSGFLVWLSGGNTSQFRSVRQGYRLQDLFLMRCSDNYTPEFVAGLYQSGLVINITLVEVTS